MAMQAVSAWTSSVNTTKRPSPRSFTTRPSCCSKILARAVVSWVTKRPAVSSPSRSKIPVLPTRSANTTEAMHDHYAPRPCKRRSPVVLGGPTGFPCCGRGGGIRPRDPLHPMQVRYQAALHAEARHYSGAKKAFRGSVKGTEEIADLEQLALQLLQLARDRLAFRGRRVLELALAEGGLLHLDDFHALEHHLARAALVALDLHDLLQLVARAADGEALVVQEVADAPDHQHLVVLVVAAVAPPLHRPQLRELLLPIPEHVRLDAAQLADLTDGEVALGRNSRKAFLH